MSELSVLRGLWGKFEPRERALAATLSLTVVVSVQAIGSVHAGTLIAVALLSTAGFLVASYVGDAKRSPFAAPAAMMLGLSLFCLVQALPVPLSILERVTPASADIWSRALAPTGESVSHGHISLDPGATLREALKGVLYVATFLTASNLAARRGTTFGITLIFASAVLLSLVSVCHWLVGATSVFGLFTPENAVAPSRMGPLLNGNTLAGYLVMGLACGIGLLHSQRAVPQGIIGVGVALCVAVLIRTGSRGGVLVFPIALVIYALLLIVILRIRAQRTSLWVPGLVLGASLVFGGVMALLAADATMWIDLGSRSMAKVALISWVGPLILAFPAFGIGRGAFESVFPAYRPVGEQNTVFTHAENLPAQWVAEWGLVVGGLALVVFAYLFRPIRLNVLRSPVAAGGFVGVLAILGQNLADLGLELPGVAVGLTALLGTLWGDRAPSTRRPRRRALGHLGPRPAAALLAALAVGLSASVVAWGLDDVSSARRELQSRLTALDFSSDTARAGFRDELRSAMLQHPADPYLPLLGGSLAWRARDQSPMPWIQRSLERGLMNGRAHLLLAEVLADRGAHQQALLEARWALRAEPNLAQAAGQLVVRIATSFDDILAATPDEPAGSLFLVHVAELLGAQGRSDLRDLCDHEALRRNDTLTRVRKRLVEHRLDHLDDESVCPSRAKCEEEIAQHAERLSELEPDSSLGAQVRARLLKMRSTEEAMSLLATECGLPKDRVSCLELRIRIALESDAPQREIQDLAKAYVRERCSTAAECGSAHRWLGDVLAHRGLWAVAVMAYADAAHEVPSPEHLTLLADAAEKAGNYARAIEALERLQRVEPTAALRERISGLRARAAARSLGTER